MIVTRRLRGLSGMPILVEADSLQTEPTLALGPNVRVVGAVGWPGSLGVMYAKRPLLWLFLLFGSGWLGGYLTWRWIGRRRR